MKIRNILLAVGFLLFMSNMGMGQKYEVLAQPLCWSISGQDSSLTRYILVSARSTSVLSITHQNAAGNEVDVSGGGTFANGYCGCCDGGSGAAVDADWWEIGTTTPPDTITDNQYTYGKVNINTVANTHGLRVDTTFTFRPLTNTHFEWQDGSITDGTPYESLLFQAPTGSGGGNQPTAGNVFTLANNDVVINDRDQLGVLAWGGTDPGGGQLKIPAFISVVGNGNWSAGTNLGATMDFYITDNNSTTPINAMTIEANGQIELDQYVGQNDGAPESMLWHQDADKDVKKTPIGGTLTDGAFPYWHNTNGQMEWSPINILDQVTEFNQTGGILLPVGTTLQQPTGELGILRVDSDLNAYRGHNGTSFFSFPESSAATFTSGSVLFANTSGKITQDNSNLYWNNTNKRLGIGTNSPGEGLDIESDTGFRVQGESGGSSSGGYIDFDPTSSNNLDISANALTWTTDEVNWNVSGGSEYFTLRADKHVTIEAGNEDDNIEMNLQLRGSNYMVLRAISGGNGDDDRISISRRVEMIDTDRHATFKLGNISTSNRDGIDNAYLANGQIIWNTTTDQVEKYNGSWGPVFDHYYGEAYILDNDPDTVTISTGGTYIIIDSTTVGEINGVSHSEGRLTYTQNPTRSFLVNCSMTFTSDFDNTDFEFRIHKNGSGVAKSHQKKNIPSSTGSQERTINLTTIISLDQNDYLEVFVTAGSTGDIFIHNLNFNISSL